MAVQLARHRFSVEDYHAMAEAGALRPDERVELIEGEIVDMALIGLRLVRGQVQVHRNPAASGFRTVDVRGRRARLELVTVPDLSLSVDELLG